MELKEEQTQIYDVSVADLYIYNIYNGMVGFSLGEDFSSPSVRLVKQVKYN